MSRLKPILAPITVGGLALLLVLQYKSVASLRGENKSLRNQLDELTQAQAAFQSASNNAAGNNFSQEQSSELLKLRGEVTHLRRQTNELAALRQQNDTLRASVKAVPAAAPSPVERVKKTAADALPQDIHPMESWAYRGYDNPDATVESMMWGVTKGDKAAFMAGLSPEMQAKLEKDMNGKDIGEEMRKAGVVEFRILDRQAVSDDEMIVTVYSTRVNNGNTAGNSEDTHFKRINGQWKVFEGK
jgi:hypothetical protein